EVRLFAGDISRQPLIVGLVQPPAVEVHVLAVLGMWRVCPIEAHNTILLVFGPNASNEHSLRLWLFRLHIDDQSSHIAQKLTTDKVKIVVLPVKRCRVHDDHLRKAFGHVSAGFWFATASLRPGQLQAAEYLLQGTRLSLLGLR